MKLSKRLSAVAAMVTPGMVLADIGTDHAYIPIDLVERDVIPRAIAADVNPGPLQRAAEHIRAHGLADRISTRLCDGLAAFEAGEVQSIVIAGMGGALTTRILQDAGHLLGDDLCEPPGEACLRRGESEAGEVCLRRGESEAGEVCLRRGELGAGEDCLRTGESGAGEDCVRIGMHAANEDCRRSLRQVPELVLQPQSEISRVRLWLWQNGWEIMQEDMVFEDGKYYPMMKARHVKDRRTTAVPAGFCPQSFPNEAGTKKMAVAVSADLYRKLCLEFGPKLLEKKHPVLWDYLRKEKVTQERILETLSLQKSPAAVSRACEIREKLSLTEEALRVYQQP